MESNNTMQVGTASGTLLSIVPINELIKIQFVYLHFRLITGIKSSYQDRMLPNILFLSCQNGNLVKFLI